MCLHHYQPFHVAIGRMQDPLLGSTPLEYLRVLNVRPPIFFRAGYLIQNDIQDITTV